MIALDKMNIELLNLEENISKFMAGISSIRPLSNAEQMTLRSAVTTITSGLAKHLSAHKALLEITKELSATPGFNTANDIIVKKACKATKAHSSELFLYDKQTKRFKLEARYSDYPYPENDTFDPKDPPRQEGGLTYKIFTTGCPLVINDLESYPGIKQSTINMGLRSLLGVPIQLGIEIIGVMYARGMSPCQFTDAHIAILEALGTQVAVFSSWTNFLFNPAEDVDKATSNLSELDSVLKELCQDIQDKLNFEFSAVQLIRPEENVIETVYGLNAAQKWAGLAKHYLTTDPDLQDIQADIAQASPVQLEIIKGYDRRFDKWIYQEFHHEDVVRVWLPIILVRNTNGDIIEDWIDNFTYKTVLQENTDIGKHIVIQLHLPYTNIKVLGTVDAGYSKKSDIPPDDAIALFKIVGRRTSRIYQCLLPSVLQTIADRAREIVGADSASLHFLPLKTETHEYYAYEIFSGPIGSPLLEKAPIRQEGLGHTAIKTRQPQCVPDSNKGDALNALQTKNPQAFQHGIKAMAAFPLLVDDKHGVLYIHYNTFHHFSNDELNWVELFANKAVGAIKRATTYMQFRDNARQLSDLHIVSQSLVKQPEAKDLLKRIAGSTANLLAADIVSIYEYFESDRSLVHEPATAGRLKDKIYLVTREPALSIPMRVIHTGDNLFVENISKNNEFGEWLASKRQAGFSSSFAEREQIKALAAILLKVGTETVGVMFINYRRPHQFSREDRQYIDILASSAAFSIKNRRVVEVLNTGDREIVNLDIDKLLDVIVHDGIQLTNADLGEFWEVDPVEEELVLKVSNSPAAKANAQETPKRFKLDHGITGWVAKHGKSQLVNDVSSDDRYIECVKQVTSELCVPLLDKSGKVLGVLNVESYREGGGFDARHQFILEALAVKAVIGLTNALAQKKLISTETMAALGELAGQLVHKVNNQIGAIQQIAQELTSSSHAIDTPELAKEIVHLSSSILGDVTYLNSWVLGDPSTLTPIDKADITKILEEALSSLHVRNDVITINKLNFQNLYVAAGKQQLKGVLDNLLQNALDAMPHGGILTISAEEALHRQQKWLKIHIEDTGMGIAKDDLGKIFERGFSSKREIKHGLGFGLWWSHAYIERLGGKLTVTSTLGKGSTFTITLKTA